MPRRGGRGEAEGGEVAESHSKSSRRWKRTAAEVERVLLAEPHNLTFPRATATAEETSTNGSGGRDASCRH
jgi:hypothetical protein